ncbi:hypothetical protein ZIOFF_001634 [Zingiber officinale]|uniref:RING-type domain-containing protein n=1 Tax=Zingiber officinale TaxID=94328 RepID=A0A8J5HV43_ZINOF|nr:hypothetical protein ZIOFF_001634 [Zingiber officinale]
MKYVLVTGEVVSGLGKGVTTSCIRVLLKSCGVRITLIKIGACLDSTKFMLQTMDFIDGDTARMMPMCNHIFHVVCIDVWLMKHDSCPTCRQEENIAQEADLSNNGNSLSSASAIQNQNDQIIKYILNMLEL